MIHSSESFTGTASAVVAERIAERTCRGEVEGSNLGQGFESRSRVHGLLCVFASAEHVLTS